MPRPPSSEPIERVTLKLPRSVVTYFRQAFRHGARSAFVAKCILAYKQEQEVHHFEAELRRVGKQKK